MKAILNDWLVMSFTIMPFQDNKKLWGKINNNQWLLDNVSPW